MEIGSSNVVVVLVQIYDLIVIDHQVVYKEGSH